VSDFHHTKICNEEYISNGLIMSINQSIILAWGWKRYFIAFCAGAIGAFAQAPFDIFPLIFITMSVSVWLIDGSTYRQKNSLIPTAYVGWWVGFGYFLCGLWWLGDPILIESGDLLWVLPLAVFGLPAGLAVFFAFAFVTAKLFWTERLSRIIVFSLSMSIAEWLRGHILTGFPWNNFGMVLGDHLYFAQITSVIGVYGLSFITILISTTPIVFWERDKFNQLNSKPFFLSIFVLILFVCFGFARLYINQSDFDHDVRLRIMQPNITNDQFRSDRSNDILNTYFRLSDQRNDKDERTIETRTHLIWPESAFPFILGREPRALERIKSFMPTQVTLLTGAARSESTINHELIGDTQTIYFNSIQAVNEGEINASVDKFHLVPFGEYLPLRALLERIGLRHLVHIPGGFEAGDKQHILNVRGLAGIAPLICYEAIFSGEVIPDGEARPRVLLNLTNDSWFGFTPGPYQHFAQARLRAIEEGLPLIRAANTGISAIIDPYGRIIKSLPIGVEGIIDGDLPKTAPETLFSLYGDKVLWTMWMISALFLIFFNRQFDQR